MSTYLHIFDFLDPYQISDDLLAQSYENVSASSRALLKQAISFHFSAHRFITPHNAETEQHFSHSASGLFYSISKRKSPYLFCVFDNFSMQNKTDSLSPALLLSILCPAIIADVQNIFFFFYRKPSDAILTTLELCGIENIFIYQQENITLNQNNIINKCILNEDILNNKNHSYQDLKNQIDSDNEGDNHHKFFAIVKECLEKFAKPLYDTKKIEKDIYLKNEITHTNDSLLNQIPENGRFILFQNNENLSNLDYDILQVAQSHNITYFHENTKLHIIAQKSQENALLFAYPQATIDFISDSISNSIYKSANTIDFLSFDEQSPSHFTTKSQNASKIFNSPKEMKKNEISQNFQVSFIKHIKAQQNYTADMEACYLHPYININFFMNQAIVASM